MKKILMVLSFVSFICSFGCRSLISSQPKVFSINMERTSCFGPCPIYDLSIESDGEVNFEGIEYTETIGKVESKISDEKIKELVAEIIKLKFFSFDDDYGYNSKNCSMIATDSPSVILTIKFDETEKTIKHYHGCFVKKLFSDEDPLKPLTNLEDKIDEIVDTKRWIGKVN